MRRSLIGLSVAGLVAAAIFPATAPSRADGVEEEGLTNPYLGQKEAIEQGEWIYKSKCIICHRESGGRGRNLFDSKLTDERFLDVVINGVSGARGQMPAFGFRMSFEDVWKVHAFVKSRDQY